MKAVILAGGFGTRISEESHLRPKPMIEIGGMPILWHIMKIYSHYGINDFVICAGYKQEYIKDWFANYYLHTSDVTFDFADGGKMNIHSNVSEPWRVSVIDTGLNTMTGGRIKRIAPYVENEKFFMTYGDGVADVDLNALLAFHEKTGKVATITGVLVTQRFGVLDIDGNGAINEFREKKETDGGVINGGFMVLEPGIFDYIDGDQTVFEQEPLNRLAANHELCAYRHEGFWKCMDSQREKMQLEEMWATGNAPWKIW